MSLKQKVFLRVDITPNCWRWVGMRHKKDGYGRYRLPGMKWDKTAHRVVYELYFDTIIPDDKVLDHLCFNKLCVNPHHLEIVTRAENSRRARVNDSEITKQRRKANPRWLGA